MYFGERVFDMKNRKDCNCICHEPGVSARHMVACCRNSDNEDLG